LLGLVSPSFRSGRLRPCTSEETGSEGSTVFRAVKGLNSVGIHGYTSSDLGNVSIADLVYDAVLSMGQPSSMADCKELGSTLAHTESLSVDKPLDDALGRSKCKITPSLRLLDVE
jgi:hypothetical protein